MKIRLFLLAGVLFAAMAVCAKTYRLEGKVGDKYPIVMELEEHDNGLFSGRYAYRLTLRRQGDGRCSWLYINPDIDNPYSRWIVSDCKHEQVELWYDVNFNGRRLTARMKNKAGRYYDVAASVAGQSNEPLDTYFKQHIGEYVFDFDMFNEPRVRSRLQKLMGILNYDALTEIYQTQVPIEYNEGMFWASGFKAHQCCDPVALWAYDTYDNSFYIWIRQDGQDSWWSESGSIPIKFREIVSETF